MKSIRFVLGGVLLSLFLLPVNLICAEESMPASSKKIQVIATLFPTWDFAREIAGEKAEVTLLLPPGVEAHTYEPKPGDIVKISKADIFIYTGEGMEPWAEDLMAGISDPKPLIVDVSQSVPMMAEGEDSEGEDEHHESEHHHPHHHGGKDPHIWTDLANCQKMVQSIANAFCQKDADHCDFYRANAKSYQEKLGLLDQRYHQELSTCRHKTILYGGHFAFGYLAHRYGLEHVSPYRGFSPDAEPTPKAVAELIDTMKKTGLKTLYYEELLEPRVAKTIASETGAKLELLHGAHNVSKEDRDRGVAFLQIMEQNLEKLKIGLECK